MNKKKKDYCNILFGYMCIPSYGCFVKDNGGFSIAVYEDVRLIHKTYIFDGIENTKTEYKISIDSFVDIKMILEKHQADINMFDKCLDNGSCDGTCNFFIFNGKRFITWNISYIDEEELKKNNLDYYKKYKSVVSQENKMLLIFDEIAEIFESQGVNLKIYEVNFSEN